jgi:hypothetical protein
MAPLHEGSGRKPQGRSRKERLEAQLRANLQRRKAQARARTPGSEPAAELQASGTAEADRSS